MKTQKGSKQGKWRDADGGPEGENGTQLSQAAIQHMGKNVQIKTPESHLAVMAPSGPKHLFYIHHTLLISD